MPMTIRQARIGINATQQELADKMGVHVQTYARMEKHPEDMTIKQAILFASIVGRPISDLYFGVELQFN